MSAADFDPPPWLSEMRGAAHKRSATAVPTTKQTSPNHPAKPSTDAACDLNRVSKISGAGAAGGGSNGGGGGRFDYRRFDKIMAPPLESLDPRAYEALLLAADQARQSGDRVAAQEMYERAIEWNGTDAGAMFRLASLRLEARQGLEDDAADGLLERAIAASPGDGTPLRALASIKAFYPSFWTLGPCQSQILSDPSLNPRCSSQRKAPPPQPPPNLWHDFPP